MKVIKGSLTALITPFNKDGSIDYKSVERLIQIQIDNQTDGIVILGSTGEAHALSHNEKKDLIQWVVKTVNKRAHVIVGTGTSYTPDTINNSKMAKELELLMLS